MRVRHPRILAVGVLSALWAIVSTIGDLQTAKEIFENRGPIMSWMGQFLFSPWAGAGLAVVCVVIMFAVEWRDNPKHVPLSLTFIPGIEPYEVIQTGTTRIANSSLAVVGSSTVQVSSGRKRYLGFAFRIARTRL
jgi:hypothetical protein